MPKWLGNRFGDAAPLNPGGPAPSAIYNMFDQYYMKQEGGYLKVNFAASGGTKVTYNGVVYHTFTSSGAFSVTQPGGLVVASIDILVQGAGGGGGVIGGGGGAGGQVQGTGVSLPTSGGPYPVVIGTGGNGGGSGAAGSDGGDTTFNTPTITLLTATGGGGGGSHIASNNSVSGRPGGCGGGGSDNSSSHPYGTSNQPSFTPLTGTFNFYGNRGGTGSPAFSSPPRGGGGGGGTGAAGGDFPGRTGGEGRPYTIPTRDNPTTQTNYWFGGGGGGSPYENSNPAPGGRGGGGGGWNDNPGGGALAPGGADGYGGNVNNNPSVSIPNDAGGLAATNSGGGGGGGRWSGPWSSYRTGGPGIVVISYPNDQG